MEDGFARGNREDSLVLADFKAALCPLVDAIDRPDTAELAALRARGDLVGLNDGPALQRAKRLLDRPTRHMVVLQAGRQGCDWPDKPVTMLAAGLRGRPLLLNRPGLAPRQCPAGR